MSDTITAAQASATATALYALELEKPYQIRNFEAYEAVVRLGAKLERDELVAAQTAELEALGGTEAAERGWNALRELVPNLDGFSSFAELPHKLKVHHATFAKGVLSEPVHVWAPGDVATITGPLTSHAAGSVGFSRGDRVEVLDSVNADGDLHIKCVVGNGLTQWISPASLTLQVTASEPVGATEPRVFASVGEIPDGVTFTVGGETFTRSGDRFKCDVFGCDPHTALFFGEYGMSERGSFVEVLPAPKADPRVFYSYEDIPAGVTAVRDADGDVWAWGGNGIVTTFNRKPDTDEYVPYTEVR